MKQVDYHLNQIHVFHKKKNLLEPTKFLMNIHSIKLEEMNINLIIRATLNIAEYIFQ